MSSRLLYSNRRALSLYSALNNKLSTAESVKPEGWDTAKSYWSIPGPKPLPLVGNSWRYIVGDMRDVDFAVIHKKYHEKFGDIWAFRKQLGMPDMVVLYRPEDIEKMFRNEGTYPIREGFTSMQYYRQVLRKDIFGDYGSLLFSYDEEWHNIRSKVNPILLQPRTAKNYVEVLDVVAQEFIERMHFLALKSDVREMPDDFDNELNKWSFESICLVALEKRLGCLKEPIDPEVQKMVRYMVDIFKMTMILDFTPIGPIAKKFNFPIWKRYIKYSDFFTDMCLTHINEAEKRILQSEEYESKTATEKSAFEKLLKIDKTLAIVMTLDMLSAGIDTTAKYSGAILYHLAKNPEKQRILRQEITSILPNIDSPMTKEAINNIPYLKAVIKEVGRLTPIAVGLVRKSTRDDVLCGYQIPKGTTLLSPGLYLSLDDKHFKRPTEFLPERWLKTTTDDLSYKNASPFIALTFGFGPRSCIGKRIANLEMEILIAKIVRNFELEWHHPDATFKQELFYGINSPLKLRLKPLQK